MHIPTGGTYTGASETLTISGSGTGTSRPLYVDSGTYTAGASSTTKFTGAGDVDIEALTYNNLQFYPTTGTETYTLLSGTVNINGNLDVNNGGTLTIDADTNDPAINLAGNLTLNVGTTWTKSASATLTLKPSGTKTWTDNTASKQDMGIISISTGASTPKIDLGSSVTATSITIAASHTLDTTSSNHNITTNTLSTNTGTLIANGSTITITGTGTPFTNSGTFTYNTSTVKYTNATGANITALTGSGGINGYYNLEVDGAGTYTLAGAVTVNNDLTVTNGALAGTNDITVKGGDATGSGTINLTGGTFLLDGAGSFGGTQSWSFSALTFGDGTNAATTTTVTGAGTIAVSTLTIAANQNLDAADATYQLSGTGTPFTKAGTFTYSTSTVRYTGSGATVTALAGTAGTDGYYTLELKPSGASPQVIAASTSQTLAINNTLVVGDGTNAGAEATTNDPNLAVKNVTIAANATLVASDNASKTFTVSGDWSNAGIFTPNQGTVTFTGTNQATLSGSTTFYNLTMNTAADGAKTILFESGSTQTIQNTWDLAGASGKVLTLNRSGGSGTDTWLFNISVSMNSGDYINVTNSGTANANKITAQSNDVDGGNNPGWVFPPTGITISGNIYQEGSESLLNMSSVSVSVSVNNGSPTTINNQTDSYSFSGVAADADDIVVVYIDGDVLMNANSFTIAGSGNITDMHLYINKTAIFSHNATTFTDTHLCSQSTYPGTGDNTFLCGSGEITFYGEELHLAASYSPSGDITASNLHVLAGKDLTGSGDLNITGGSVTGDGSIIFTGDGNPYLTNIAQIEAGSSHTCAISNAGNAYCWGDDTNGQLGNGATTGDQDSPVRVLKGTAATTDTDGTNLTNIAQIEAGSSHTCAISNAGNAYCWGDDTNGQLGNGATTGDQDSPGQVVRGDMANEQSDATYLTNIKSISASSSHTCAVSNAGNAYCWGGAANGKLGNNSTSPNQLVPVRVLKGSTASADNDGTYLTNINSVSAGSSHTCAVSNAGNAYCWGKAQYGVLGNNSTSPDQLTPVRVLKGAAASTDNDGTNLTNVRSIATGNAHTCAVSNVGNAYCWGMDGYGILGNNASSGTSNPTPVRVLKGAAAASDNDGTNLSNIRSITNNTYHTCAVSNAGNAYCWGYATFGRLGNNVTSTTSYSTPVRVLKGAAAVSDNDNTNLTNIRLISAGSSHTCAVSNAGNAYCWGESSSGELGNNITSTDQPIPVRVLKGAAATGDNDGTNLVNISYISSDGYSSCAVSNAGNAYCWGDADYGKLGNNSTSPDQPLPVRVLKGNASDNDTDDTNITNIQTIDSGGFHTCAVSNAGNAYCWGGAGSGQLGNNLTTPDQTIPIRPLIGSAPVENTFADPIATIGGTGTFGGATNWSFHHLTFGDTTTDTTTASGTGKITVTGTLTIAANHTLNAGDKTYEFLAAGTPFVKTGALTPENSTFDYAGTSAQTITSATYNNLTLTSASAVTKTAGGAVTTNGGLTIGANNTLDVGSGLNYSLSIKGNYTNNGTFSARQGAVTLSGTSPQILSGSMTGSSSFYDLVITNTSGIADPGCDVSFTPGIEFAASATATGTFTITTGNVKVEYLSGGTYTFANINWNGQLSDTKIQMRNSNLASGSWNLVVTGTQTVQYVDVARSDAGSGDQISATNSTNCNNNVNWQITSDSAFKPTPQQMMRHGKWFNNGLRQKMSF